MTRRPPPALPPGLVDSLWQEACQRLGANDPAGAEQRLHRLLGYSSGHVQALHLLGKLRLAAGDGAGGLARLSQAAELAPGHPELAFEAGVAGLMAGRIEQAVPWFRRQLDRHPGHEGALYNLAWALRRLGGQDDEAVLLLKRLLVSAPGHADGWFNLGNALAVLNHHRAARMPFRRALALKGDHEPILVNLARSLLRCGRLAEARQMVDRLPHLEQASEDRGLLLAELAEAGGLVQEALSHYDRLLAINPGQAIAAIARARLLARSGRGGGEDALYRALRHTPDPSLLVELAEAAARRGDQGAVERAAMQALVLSPVDAVALNTLGKTLALRGELVRAAVLFRRIVACEPHQYGAHGNVLFAMLHDDQSSPEAVFAEARAFGEYWESRSPAPEWRPSPTDTAGRRLRIGYVSPDFCDHAVALIIAPILERHDRGQVEVVCYHVPRQIDEVTARLRRHADQWRTLEGSDFAAMAAMVHADRIDILVDLAGHTNRNVLPLFALKPAPIQVSAIGYPGTTGLSRMDYRLVYGGAPKQSDDQAFSSETLVTLPASLPYALPEATPEVTSPPCLRQGHITFGSVSKFAKVNREVRRCWAALLDSLPTARLLLIAPSANTPGVGAQVKALFAAEGVDPARIDVENEGPLDEWLARLGRIDIVLDPFPYAGGTTVMFAQWMGVPVITLRPDVTREGQQVREGYCNSVGHYLETARAFATRPAELVRLRAELRARVLVETELNQSFATRSLEDWYRQAWHCWLAGGLWSRGGRASRGAEHHMGMSR